MDLGLVGEPADCNTKVVEDLLDGGYVPVIASIGITADGALLNINADTFAAHLAASLRADRLIVAGTTPGVFDADGRTIPALGQGEIDAMTADGTAHSGMIAKLVACRQAVAKGVGEVSIVAGRGVADYVAAPGTRITALAASGGPRSAGLPPS